MSARATAAPAPVRRQVRHRPALTLVRPRPPALARRRWPFAVLIAAILAGGLVLLLLLNTMAAQDAFRVRDLSARLSVLQNERQALQLAVAADSQPAAIAARARALGMVPAPGPAFLSGRKVVGDLALATAPPPPPKPSPSPSAGTRRSATTTKAQSTAPTPAPTQSKP